MAGSAAALSSPLKRTASPVEREHINVWDNKNYGRSFYTTTDTAMILKKSSAILLTISHQETLSANLSSLRVGHELRVVCGLSELVGTGPPEPAHEKKDSGKHVIYWSLQGKDQCCGGHTGL